eukprot:COSAG06_NODE_741_length_12661_cov_24.506607_1_plen_188_part_00
MLGGESSRLLFVWLHRRAARPAECRAAAALSLSRFSLRLAARRGLAGASRARPQSPRALRLTQLWCGAFSRSRPRVCLCLTLWRAQTCGGTPHVAAFEATVQTSIADPRYGAYQTCGTQRSCSRRQSPLSAPQTEALFSARLWLITHRTSLSARAQDERRPHSVWLLRRDLHRQRRLSCRHTRVHSG